MRVSNKLLRVRAVKLLNVIAVTTLFAVCWYLYYADKLNNPYYFWGNIAIIALFLVVYVLFGRIYDIFQISHYRISVMIYSQGLSIFFSDIIIYIVICLLIQGVANPLPLLVTFAAQLMFAALWSVVAHKWYFRFFPPHKTAVIYDNREGMDALISEYGLEKKYKLERICYIDSCINDLGNTLNGMDTVFISGVHSHERNVILKYCVAHGIRAYIIPRVGDVLMSSAKQVHLFHLPMLMVKRHDPSFVYTAVKRLFDIIFSLTAIIALSPVLIVTSIAIKVGDGGPVIYKQKRLTQNGRIFNVYKFRSMCVDAEKDGVARLSTGKKDDRITPVGRVIRKCRVDELPQLFNILGGSMTIVGPRPERPEIAKEYEKVLPEFALRLQVKAGLTGYAQVYGKYNTAPYDKLLMDLMYISKPSVAQDLLIMFATIKILFLPESTQGVEEDQITAMDAKRENSEK